jgi:membrane associated rhomboid family serine protease
MTLIFIGLFVRVVTIPTYAVLLFWIILQVINGTVSLSAEQSGGVAWFAHIGGFGAGLLFIKLFRKADYMRGMRVE